MTIVEMFNYAVNFVNENPKTAITILIGVLELIGRNVKSERNLSIIQNVIMYLTMATSMLDKVVTNKTSTPNVVYTTQVTVARVEVKSEIDIEESIS